MQDALGLFGLVWLCLDQLCNHPARQALPVLMEGWPWLATVVPTISRALAACSQRHKSRIRPVSGPKRPAITSNQRLKDLTSAAPGVLRAGSRCLAAHGLPLRLHRTSSQAAGGLHFNSQAGIFKVQPPPLHPSCVLGCHAFGDK